MYFGFDIFLRSHYCQSFESLGLSIELESSSEGADFTCLIDLKVDFSKLRLFNVVDKSFKEEVSD
jgi:hypothetical protein